MIVRTFEFDRAKLDRLVERREGLHAALLRATERRNDAREEKQRAEDAINRCLNDQQDPPQSFAIRLKKAAEELERREVGYQRAQEAWQTYGFVPRLQEAARHWANGPIGKQIIARGQGHD